MEYFEKGIDAKAFIMPPNPMFPKGKVLEKNEDLWWGFNSKGYQYTLRRQPLNTSGNDMNSIMNELFQSGKKK